MKKLLVIVLAFVSFNINAQDTLTKSFEDSVIVEFTQLLNQHRKYTKNIFTKIENNVDCNNACKKHSEYQASIHTVTHDRIDGYKSLNYYGNLGENAACSFSRVNAKQTAVKFFEMWKTSIKGHNYNLIRKEAEYFGLGLALSDNGYIYATYQIGN